ncbi:ATP-binding protein [Streptomyces hygroscopicus]|uniref:ATP-binding protein n=1 Tax=Streptomyces hygroscopicus TaxID=1912 RepID=UPI00362612D6
MAHKDGLPPLIAYLTRVLKTPTTGFCWEDLAAQARDENWSHEEYLAVAVATAGRRPGIQGDRDADPHGTLPAGDDAGRRQPDHLPSLRQDVLAHHATGTFVTKSENMILLGPPGIGKTHLTIGLKVKTVPPLIA